MCETRSLQPDLEHVEPYGDPVNFIPVNNEKEIEGFRLFEDNFVNEYDDKPKGSGWYNEKYYGPETLRPHEDNVEWSFDWTSSVWKIARIDD